MISKRSGSGCRHGRFAKGTALGKVYTIVGDRRGETRRQETRRQETGDKETGDQETGDQETSDLMSLV
jgi:hypothetical protein